ncbi:hypothetical protein DVR12_14170 [Chitinophaga silvatica]|uniref:Uncharacterized protein n=1 Tax=Chitinophaga silvatica TaxID=2282649 RepID=A0A3E1Y8X8_9BACT|nr:hypothetical protein [Chitinophaga silvatica]RFS21801.1 hypothetical protein DVR12_14170 [Chitinophaga silvatica]
MKTVEKTWEDSTDGWSKIERLNFDGDRYWEECTITINGKNSYFPTGAAQKFTIYLNDEKIFDEYIHGTKVKTKSINSDKGFSVTGTMSSDIPVAHDAIGSITVECTYKESSVLKSKSVSWSDGGFVTIMERLFLDATETWKKCEILVEGKPNTPNHFSLQLIKDGSLVDHEPKIDQLFGTGSRKYTYDINAKETLLVVGYFIAGGGKVTLTGIY